MSASRGFRRVWSMPLLLATLTLFGLLAALLGEGWWWPLSWIALGSPLLVAGWCLMPQDRQR